VVDLKKTYSKPECISMSHTEAARLLCERFSEQPQFLKLGLPTDKLLAPILILVGYLGDTVSIQRDAHSRKIHGHLCRATDDSRLVHIPCPDSRCNPETRPDFLLLDLRPHGLDRVNIVRKAGSGGVPLVILTTANLDAELSEFCDQCGAWRMIGPISAVAAQALSGMLDPGHVLGKLAFR
jgi:hypothetical protein